MKNFHLASIARSIERSYENMQYISEPNFFLTKDFFYRLYQFSEKILQESASYVSTF